MFQFFKKKTAKKEKSMTLSDYKKRVFEGENDRVDRGLV